jgi:mono/diheme cytochrome c family protein
MKEAPMKTPPLLALALGLSVHAAAPAEAPRDFLARFEGEARSTTPSFAASPSRGEHFFHRAGASDWRCSTCHTDNPAQPGKHAKTGKAIEPLAPVANVERFTRPDKVDKWFKRNCNDVLERACTPAEKADLVAYLLSVAK